MSSLFSKARAGIGTVIHQLRNPKHRIYYFGSSILSQPVKKKAKSNTSSSNSPSINSNNNKNKAKGINTNTTDNITSSSKYYYCSNVISNTYDLSLSFGGDEGEIEWHCRHTYPNCLQSENTDNNNLSPPDITLFFLHGAAFSSETWYNLGTLNLLSQYGYNTIAIDIPGYGKSPTYPYKFTQKKFIDIVKNTLENNNSKNIDNKDNKRIIIVTASMSGTYAVPLLFEDNRNELLPFELVGMITIAPVSTDRYKDDEYSSNVNIPILAIYGENDIGLGVESIENLSKTKECTIVEIPKGSHPAYLDNPQLFHEKVLQFCNSFVY